MNTAAPGYVIYFCEYPKTAYIYDFTVNYGFRLRRWNYCPYCGKKLKPDWVFCPFCGSPIRCGWAIDWKSSEEIEEAE